MTFADLSAAQFALLALPILPNLACIWHVMHRFFRSETEKYLWLAVCIFLPLAGALAYLAFGMRHSRRQPPCEPQAPAASAPADNDHPV